jgi:Flp pilus assembly protein TadG
MRTAKSDTAKTANVLGTPTLKAAGFRTDETGSLTIFSLFLFVLLLFISGMAVDMIHQEQRRVAIQNAMDSGVLAAASLDQSVNAETLVRDYVARAGFDPQSVTVASNDVYTGNRTGLYSRQVTANATVSSDTIFMGLMGISSLNSPVQGAATEIAENVEISLVVDISGSMGWSSADPTKTKIDALKDAANTFIDAIFAANDPEKVSISIIPYNHQVHLPDSLLSRLNVNDRTETVSPVPPYAGALTEYETGNPLAPCFVFQDADFQTLELGASNSFTRSSNFLADNFYWQKGLEIQQAYETPYEWARWCGTYAPKIFPFSNDPVALKAHINTLEANGATAINVGLNYGLALLDDSFGGIVTGMVNNNELSRSVAGRPFAYNAPGNKKYVVLMTDGENTQQYDLKPEFKSGPTRIWHANSATTGSTTYDDAVTAVDAAGVATTTTVPTTRDKSTYDGYFVLMPNNTPDQRWYVPGSPNTTSDDQYVAEADLPSDALQLDYLELYNRFGFLSAANFLFQHADGAAHQAHLEMLVDAGGFATADTRLSALCSLARTNDRVKIFTVAFEAPVAGETALRNCAFAPGFYFDVDGTDIRSAFQSIAGQIAVLRLTE